METIFTLPAICEGIHRSPVVPRPVVPLPGGFPSQRAGNMDFDVFFDVTLNK